MKIVIENYMNAEDTQALYFNNELRNYGHEVIIFDQSKNSIYDILDIHKPEIYISHAFRLSQDLLFYLENNKLDLDILLNINGLSKQDIENFDKFFAEKNINSSFFFTCANKNKLPKINHNILTINNAADINLINQTSNIEYYINKAIFVYDKDSIKNYEDDYHVITTNPKIKESVDICLPEISLAPLYKFYNTIIFRDFLGYLPQAFFDAIIMGAKVYFDLDNKDHQEEVTEICKKLLKLNSSLDYNTEDKLNDFTELKNYILEKHTSKNRTNTLISNIKKRALS